MGCWVPIVGVLGFLWGGEGHVFGIGGQQKAASGCWVPMGGIWGRTPIGGGLRGWWDPHWGGSGGGDPHWGGLGGGGGPH